jgi:hypothetical protein
MKAKFTKWTATQPVTKRLRLADDGSIEKTSTASMLYDGVITRLECTPAEFIKTLKNIGANDCLSYGIPVNAQATQITTQRKFTAAGQPLHMAPRTAEAMAWPQGPGVMLVDYDPEDIALSPQQLRDALYQCCPALEVAAHVWAASTSSCLVNKTTGQEVRGVKGQRVYVFAADATDIPRAAAVLAKRAWLNGFGYIKISKSGQMLVRCIIDTAVFQTNRIDYCAPAECEPPLKQVKPKPELHGNPVVALDTMATLLDLTHSEEDHYQRLVTNAKAAKTGEAKVVRDQYILNRVSELVATGMNHAGATRMVSASLERNILGPDFVLTTEDGDQVTVGELLKNRNQWHGTRFCDPIEPDYHQDHRIARAYLLGPGRPRLHSFAHGSHSYELTAMTETVRLAAGGRHAYMNQVATVLNQRSELYRRADRLVAITPESTFEVQTEHHVLTIFDRSFRFEKFNEKKKEWLVSDPPATLAQQFLGAFGSQFPVIKALITAPIMDPHTRRLLNTTGYDTATGVYAAMPDDVHPVILQPTLAEVEQALQVLWWSVRLFPYAEPVDETVMLTAMLTAIERPLLPTAPGFAFDAPVQASGKSLLTKVLAELSGTTPVMSPHPGASAEQELRKAIFAMLLEGRRVIVFDNVIGEVDSPSLAAVYTSSTYSDRILTKSKTGTVPTNALILMSGNNITLKGDLPRRVLKCRIDPKTETPHQRSFDFDPAAMVRDHRQQIVAAALTIINGFITLGKGVALGKGRTASFDAWDDIIRQTVCWLTDLQKRGLLPSGQTPDGLACPRLVDPLDAIADAISVDPGLLQLGRLLDAWSSTIGTGYANASKMTVKELVKTYGYFKPATPGESAPDCPTLAEVFAEIAGVPRTSEINNKKLGTYFAAHADRVLHGRTMRQGKPYQGAGTWWVEDVGESGDSGESDLSDSKKMKGNVISIDSKKNSLTKATRVTALNDSVAERR